MQRPSLRTRVRLLLAVIGFAIAMLIGGGAPADFVDVPKGPFPTQQPNHP
jgi:hypothetical protein